MTETNTSSGPKLPEWLRGIWDAGTGIFNRFADLELRKKELELFQEASQSQNQQVSQQQARQDAFNGTNSFAGGIDTNTMLLLGAGAIALIVLARR